MTECLPGLAAKLTGTDIPEYSFVAPDDGKVMVDWDGTLIEAALFNDLLLPVGDGAEVLAAYTSGYYTGEPALIRNRFGKGEAYYFGGAFAVDTAKVFLQKLGVSEPWSEFIELSESCELALREKEDGKYLFVLNYQAQPEEITLKREMKDMLTGQNVSGKIVLEKYGVAVYRI